MAKESSVDKALKAVGGIVTSGYGDRVLMGVIMRAFGSPARCYQYIKDDVRVFHWASGKHWRVFKDLAKRAKIGKFTKDTITSELRKLRPDLLGVILNTQGGGDWLDRQIVELNKKLE